MPSTTLTSKGQMTVPKSVRDRFDLKAGDRLEVVVEDDRIVLIPMTLHIEDLGTLLPATTHAATIAEMDDSIRSRASQR